MDEQIQKIKQKKKWYKRKKFIILISIVILFIIIIAFFNKNKNQVEYETAKVILGNLVQTVDATGNIKSADEIDLRFENIGKVSNIYKKVNEEVKEGDLIMELENSNEKARLAQVNASLQKYEANLSKILAGETSFYIENLKARYDQSKANLNQIKATTNDNISNVESVLATAENNLKLAEGGGDSIIIQNAYQDLIAQMQVSQDSVSSALISSDNILGIDNKVVNDDFEDYLSSLDRSKLSLATSKYNIAKEARDDIDEKVSEAVFSDYDYEKINILADDILYDLAVVKDMLVSMSQMLNATVAVGTLSQTELDAMKTSIQTARTSVSSNNASLINYVQAITTAENSYNSYLIAYEKAENNLDNIKLKSAADIAAYESLVDQARSIYEDAKNPARSEDVLSAEASVNEARANVNQVLSSLNKTKIFAPVDGILGKIDAKVGEYVNSSDIVAKIVNPHFEIKVDVPETDIVKLNIDDTAEINLDAYGDDIKFSAKVIEIEQGETVIQEVIYYSVTLSLEEKENKEEYNIFNGMTADVLFYTEEKDNILYIPQRVILSDEDGEKYVRILSQDNEIINKDVTTGMKGDDGYMEITQGLEEGEEVIIRTIE